MSLLCKQTMNKKRGVGGFFALKRQKIPKFIPSDVSIIKLTPAKEGQLKIEEVISQSTDSSTNLKDHILSGNELNDVDPSTKKTMELSTKRKSTDTKSVPKSKRTKKKDMEIFKSSFFK